MKLTNAVEFYSCLIAIMDHYGYDHQVYEKLPEEVDELNTAFDEYFEEPSPEHWHLLLYNIQMDMLNGSVKNPLTVKKNGQKTVFVVFATASFYP